MPVTSTDERRDNLPFLAATPAGVEQGIRRELLKHGFITDGPVLIDPELIAAVMTVARPVLEAKDDEITRLRVIAGFAATVAESAAGECVTVLELAARASERVRCAALLDSLGFTEAADALTAHPGARALDARKTGQP